MKSRNFQPSSRLRTALIVLLIMGATLYCKPEEGDTDLGFWAVVAWARAVGLVKNPIVNDCLDDEVCPNQTEGDFTAKSSFLGGGFKGSCNIASVSLCINLPAFGKAAQFCERSDGELSLNKCAVEQDKLRAVGTCDFHRGQAVFYGPLYTAANGATLCSRVYKGRFEPGYVP